MPKKKPAKVRPREFYPPSDDEILKMADGIRRRQAAGQEERRRAESRKLVGACFKYLQAQGGEKKREYPIYTMVIGVGPGGWPSTVSFSVRPIFEHDREVRFTSENSDMIMSEGNRSDGYVRIRQAEYNQARAKALQVALFVSHGNAFP